MPEFCAKTGNAPQNDHDLAGRGVSERKGTKENATLRFVAGIPHEQVMTQGIMQCQNAICMQMTISYPCYQKDTQGNSRITCSRTPFRHPLSLVP
jgi:hypothetical protein